VGKQDANLSFRINQYDAFALKEGARFPAHSEHFS
jgi:hypothetical protein